MQLTGLQTLCGSHRPASSVSVDDGGTGKASYRWWDTLPEQGRTATLAMSLPNEVLQLICSSLEDRDLLALRSVCRAWRAAPALAVNHVDIPMRWQAGNIPAIAKGLKQVFPNVSVITLSSLTNIHITTATSQSSSVRSSNSSSSTAAGTSRRPLHSLLQQQQTQTVTLTWIVNNLTALPALRCLRLHDVPLVAAPTPTSATGAAGSGLGSGRVWCDWDLGCLRNLKRVTSLEVRLSVLTDSSGHPTVESLQTAQDNYLTPLPTLTHLTHLCLRLVDLARVARQHAQDNNNAHINTHNGQQGQADEGGVGQGGEESGGDGGASDGSVGEGEEGGVLLEADELDLVDLDHNEPHPISQDAPNVQPFVQLGAATGCRLRSLEITNVALRHDALERLLKSLPCLTHVTLEGRVALSHGVVGAVGCMSTLRHLALGDVQLIFSESDAEDCPESLMGALYATLGHIQGFESLKFSLADMDRTRFLHTAYLLGLWETYEIRSKLRSLTLRTVIWDSDYSVGILASLTHLTSLKVHYETWPLSLMSNDLSQLSALSLLHSLHLHATDDEENYLVAVTHKVVDAWAKGLTRLAALHWTGPILLDSPHIPSLSHWTSLTDLSLSHITDPATHTTTRPPPSHTPSLDANGQPLPSPPTPPYWRCDSTADGGASGSHGSLYGGRIVLDLRSSLPRSLEKLSLSRVAVSMTDMVFVVTGMPGLKSLQLSECGVTAQHLLLLGDVPKPPRLELLILHDPHTVTTATVGDSKAVSASQAAAADEDTQKVCNGNWLQSRLPPWRLWCGAKEAAGKTGRSAQSTECAQGADHAVQAALEGQRTAPLWWTRQQEACARLGVQQVLKRSAGSLTFAMLVLPVRLGPGEVLGALQGCSRVKALTLQAPECEWSADEVLRGLTGCLRGLRALYITSGKPLPVQQRATESWLRAHPYL